MGIVLKRDNIVKEVDSEDKAVALEAKGFARLGGTAPVPQVFSLAEEIVKLKQQLSKAAETIELSNKRKAELEEELASAKQQLQEAGQEIQALKNELEGTKEQLEAAVKKNKTANVK